MQHKGFAAGGSEKVFGSTRRQKTGVCRTMSLVKDDLAGFQFFFARGVQDRLPFFWTQTCKEGDAQFGIKSRSSGRWHAAPPKLGP